MRNGKFVLIELDEIFWTHKNHIKGGHHIFYLLGMGLLLFVYYIHIISAKKPRNLFLQFTVLTRAMNSCEMKGMRQRRFISFNSTVLIRGEAYIKFRYLIASYIWSKLINFQSEVFISTTVCSCCTFGSTYFQGNAIPFKYAFCMVVQESKIQVNLSWEYFMFT